MTSEAFHDGPFIEGPLTEGPLAALVREGRESGLERWADPSGSVGGCWIAPPGTTATLSVAGGNAEVAELQWSARCAQLPGTRAVVLLAGPGSDDPAADFTAAHLVAEEVAEFVTTSSGVEAGPIEVLILRPDTDHPPGSPMPGPTATPGGAEFQFPHRGGADVRLTLTLPTPPVPEQPRSTPPGEA